MQRLLQGLWRWLLAGLLGAAWLPALSAHAPAEGLGLELAHAQFSAELSGADEQPVTLPDTWAQRGLSNRGTGVYRLAFALPQLPQEAWALRIDRLADQHEIRLNGALLSRHMTPERDLSTATSTYSRAIPAWLPLPEVMLRRGDNELLITVRHTTRGGLSPVVVGPSDRLRHEFQYEQWRVLTIPVMVNSAGMAVSLFMLIFWWQRRREQLVGGFGLLWLLISVRNLVQVVTPTESRGALLEGFIYLSQNLSALMLGLLALGLADRRRSAWHWVLGITCSVLILAALPAAALGKLDTLHIWAYPLLMAAVLPPLWQVARSMLHLKHGVRPLLTALPVLVLLIASVHDYLCWRGDLSVMAVYWNLLVLPLTLSLFGWELISRVIGALREVERINTDLEGRVAERTQAVEQAHRAKTRFLEAASHDLRQPVVSIGLMVDLLRDQMHAPALLRLVDRVDEAMASLEQLLKGLLDLSRLDAGLVQPRRSTVALQPLFDAIEAHEQPAAARKGLRLRLRPTPLAVHTDAVLLEQILRNLVGNALRYTAHGGVLIAARQHGAQVRLQVWDSGIGIAEDQQSVVFEEFVQSRQAGDKGHAGLGLGLAIVRQATRLLGHELRLRSRVGRGSCFELSLPPAGPLKRQALPRNARHTARHPAPTAAARSTAHLSFASAPSPITPAARPLSGLRLAVVDDDATVREALAARLSAWGAQVQSFPGVTPLRQRLAQRQNGHSPVDIDVMITDWQLEGANGLQAIGALHSYAGPTPVLVITGNIAPAALAVLADSGVPVLYKPFRAEALLEAVLRLARPSEIEAQPGARRNDHGLDA